MLPVDTARLRLRRLEPRDATAFAAYRSDERVARYQSWVDLSRRDAETFIDEHAQIPFGAYDRWVQVGIALLATDRLIGDIGVCVRAPGDVAEIGFSLDPDAQGNGYATEACGGVMELLAAIGVTRVVASTDARNAPSIALLERLGMVYERSEEAEFKGAPCVEHHYAKRLESR
jgi:RimJ/RimL family protein N-acetyltransferase